MDKQKQLAFEFALASTKQIMTLATGVLALTITFSKEYLKTFDSECKILAIIGWILFVFSIIFGQWTLLALTGSLCEKEPSINGFNVRLPSIMQIVTFLLGMVVAVFFTIKAL